MATLVKMKDTTEPKLMSVIKNNDDIVYASINVNICQLTIDNVFYVVIIETGRMQR